MLILGIESSCDECAAAVIKDKNIILSNVIATQIAKHRKFYGVVPELASRLHTEMIQPVVEESLDKAGVTVKDIDAVAVTSCPGLLGSLLVGVNFAKAFAMSAHKPLISVNHIMAHLYAAQIDSYTEYPYIGVLVSGGHSLIAKVSSYRDIEVMGASVDDAIGEAFDKVAKFYDMGYPGGVCIDRLAGQGDNRAFAFPRPHLNASYYRKYDMSFSGLKSAVINQRMKFLKGEDTKENIAASFQRVAVRIIVDRVKSAVEDTGINRVVFGGGVAANSLLRSEVKKLEKNDVSIALPPLVLCTDNAVMVAGIGSMYFEEGIFAGNDLSPSARVMQFKGGLKKS